MGCLLTLRASSAPFHRISLYNLARELLGRSVGDDQLTGPRHSIRASYRYSAESRDGTDGGALHLGDTPILVLGLHFAHCPPVHAPLDIACCLNAGVECLCEASQS